MQEFYMKTLVVHAASLKARGEHMERMLSRMGIDYEFIREGDLDALDSQLMSRFFKDGETLQPTARHSCATKHFLACEYIVNHDLEGALVLEDDIVLHDNFKSVYAQSLDELRSNYKDCPAIISYEDSSLRFVPRSQRRRGRLLYPATKGRMAGCYYMSRRCAEIILHDLATNKCDATDADTYHYELLQRGLIVYLWCQPTIATQGTFSGAFRSSLADDGPFVRWRWLFKKNYKKLLYWLR